MAAERRSNKVLVIGLDCADPKLVFEDYIDDLPTFRMLAERGAYGVMKSILPPITVPAWSCMASSKDPGQLGTYGMRNRGDWSYDKMIYPTSLTMKEPRLWDIVGGHGRKSFVFAVPQTYPPRHVNGEMISCWFMPSLESNYTYPLALKDEIRSLVGDYISDVHPYRTDKKDWLLGEIHKMTEQHFTLARHFIANHDWDLFWMVDMGPDRLHHGFWGYMDPQHHRYQAGNPYEYAIRDYYKFVDKQLALLLEHVDLDTTTVWVVSDHGAKSMKGGVCFNDWLIKQGYMVLKDDITGPTRFADVNVDWDKTKATGEGGFYGRCFFNVKDRESNGQVPQADYHDFGQEVIDKLEAMVDHQGNPMGTQASRPNDVYKETKGYPPDLIVLFGGMDWRSVGSVGNPSIYTFENDTGPDDANHRIEGMFICTSPGDRTGNTEISIYDFAPSVLEQMGVPVPADMIGRSIVV